MNRSIASTIIESELNSQQTKVQARWLHRLIIPFREELTVSLLKLLKKKKNKTAEDLTLSNSFYEVTITLIPKPAKDSTR